MIRPRRNTAEQITLPAPVDGLNTIAAGPAVPPSECLVLENLRPDERGLSVRNGWAEWATGLAGANENTARSIIGFHGTDGNGNADRLFAVTNDRIWDITSGGLGPHPNVLTLPVVGAASGETISTSFTNEATTFAAVCDEENGYLLYRQDTQTWAQVPSGTTQAWANSTSYFIGNLVVNGGNEYVCDTDGLSDALSTGPSGTGADIVDGTTRWDYVGPAVAGALGPSLADQQAGLSIDPGDLVFVLEFKGRLWFVERDASRAWYLDVGAVTGTATSFPFPLHHGGELVGIYAWSYDAGGGLATLMVALSRTGDVVIYQGTDPNDAATWSQTGAWFVDALPAGRRVATDFGGEMLVMSLRGVVPLSRLIRGGAVELEQLYVTAKIGNLFTKLAQEARGRRGWAIVVHPTDNALLLLIPQAQGNGWIQLAQSFARPAWSVYRDVPMTGAAAVWRGELYFGGDAGVVARNRGSMDKRLLDDVENYEPIRWRLLTGFTDLRNGRNKRVLGFRPIFESGSAAVPHAIQARYDYDKTVAPDPALPAGGGPNSWDTGNWDEMLWSGSETPSKPLTGAVGEGKHVAVALTGLSTSPTTLVAINVTFEQGGTQ